MLKRAAVVCFWRATAPSCRRLAPADRALGSASAEKATPGAPSAFPSSPRPGFLVGSFCLLCFTSLRPIRFVFRIRLWQEAPHVEEAAVPSPRREEAPWSPVDGHRRVRHNRPMANEEGRDVAFMRDQRDRHLARSRELRQAVKDQQAEFNRQSAELDDLRSAKESSIVPDWAERALEEAQEAAVTMNTRRNSLNRSHTAYGGPTKCSGSRRGPGVRASYCQGGAYHRTTEQQTPGRRRGRRRARTRARSARFDSEGAR